MSNVYYIRDLELQENVHRCRTRGGKALITNLYNIHRYKKAVTGIATTSPDVNTVAIEEKFRKYRKIKMVTLSRPIANFKM